MLAALSAVEEETDSKLARAILRTSGRGDERNPSSSSRCGMCWSDIIFEF